MPCVLPILAIKVLSLASHSHNASKYRRNSLGYAVGGIVCFVALGVLATALKGLGVELGWGFQLQSPSAIALLCVLFTLIALNLLGVFEVYLLIPEKVLAMHSEDPIWEGFISGVLSVLVAAPCTAPFMGASLGWALIAPSWQGILIFATLGVGMAFPIVAISCVPTLARLMPQPGQWMNNLRMFLAYPMILTVVWLLWVFAQLLDLNQMMLLFIDLITLSALIFGLRLSATSKRFSSCVFGLVLILVNVVWFNLGQSEDDSKPRTSTDPIQATSDSPKAVALNWENWTPELAAQTLEQGRPVFVDFTAAWCLTCQVNERTTLQNDEIRQLLLSKNVRLLRADWTKPNAVIAQTLAQLGRSGIPVYLLQRPNKPQIMLSEVLKIQDLRDALGSI
jgi:thiol:disulfide interchange protein DsbD